MLFSFSATILGNDTAIDAYRKGKQSFPDGSVIARLAWNYVPSAENNKVFGREQSFVAGSAPDCYLQVHGQGFKKIRRNRRLGYAQFDKDGNPAVSFIAPDGIHACHKFCAARSAWIGAAQVTSD
jgi:hypothetical protein